jgi:hypothetical protein
LCENSTRRLFEDFILTEERQNVNDI